MLFQLLKRKLSSESLVVFPRTNDLMTQSKETEKKCDVQDRKVLNRKEIQNLRIMEEDKEDIYRPQEKVEFRNLHPFRDVVFSILYVDFETIS